MTTTSLYQLPTSLPADLEQLRQMSEQFQSGSIPAARFQAFRVPQGVYEQRESGKYMLRIRLPAGILQPEQMRVAAEVANTYGNATVHFTSRQDLQIHGVPLENIHAALQRLAEVGLSTKGGGGNTVRNIAACHRAGICANEAFDVTPHVVRLTEHLLPDPLSYQLPRKYKIAFSGCSRDCGGATVNDLGLIAKVQDGQQGFTVYVGGGMGAHSSVGQLLEKFVPADDVPRVAEAIKRVFDKHGNRKNRHHARLRFLIGDLGLPEFQRLYRAELDQLHTAAQPALRPVITPSVPAHTPTVGNLNASFDYWRQTHVAAQKQPGLFAVEISRVLDAIPAEDLLQLALVIERYGEGVLRATKWQNAVLRSVPETDLPALHTELTAIRLGEGQPPILRHLVACAGAATCRLGICRSRGLAQAIKNALLKSDLQLRADTGRVQLHISGCPNACGRHPIAPIGFFGVARRVHGHLVPHYVLQLGGHVAEGQTTLATGDKPIPARNIPRFLVEFLQAFEHAPQYPDFEAFLTADGRTIADTLAQAHATIPDFDEDKNYYYDWSAKEIFSLAGRGPGECGAGVFDLIEIDLASAAEALQAHRLFTAVALSARALLVTRGEQADTDVQSLQLFQQHFVATNLIAPELHPLISQAISAVATPDPLKSFVAQTADVAALLAAVRKLYENMGPSLRVPTVACAAPVLPTPNAVPIPADLTQDFRGVVCPLNYVKTKMALSKIKVGQVLAVLLDKPGSENVPASATKEGHTVLAVLPEGQHWRILIRKEL